MEDCGCGVKRRRFWLWQDSSDILHASSFEPSSGVLQVVLAVTSRDALMPLGGRIPRHSVSGVDDSSIVWQGRCVASTGVSQEWAEAQD